MKSSKVGVAFKRSAAVAAVMFAAATGWATTFTWTGGAGDGNWSTAGNWDVGAGYPSTTADMAYFPAGLTANVCFDVVAAFGTLNVTNSNLNVTFTQTAEGTVTCTTLNAGAEAVTVRQEGNIVFDGVSLLVSGNTMVRPNPGKNLRFKGGSAVSVNVLSTYSPDKTKVFYTQTDFVVEGDSSLTVRSRIELVGAGTLSISNATVSTPTVYLNGDYNNEGGNNGKGGGGRIRFFGESPILSVSSTMVSESTAYTGGNGADVEFFVPIGGYEEAPIQYTGTTSFMLKPTKGYKAPIRFTVRGDSPFYGTTTYGSCPLVACTRATIDTTGLTLTTGRSTVTETLTLADESKTLVFASYDPASCLTVTGAPREFGAGGYGVQRGLANGAAQTLTAPASDSENLTCSGYKVYDVAADGKRTLVSSGSGTTCSYSHGKTRREVVWQWTRPDVYVATTGEDGDDRGDVDHPLATIQAGIDKYDYAVVHVAVGRYLTTATTTIAAGKGVEVRGEGTDPAQVILEKTANDTHVLSVDATLSTVTNITVTNGNREHKGGVSLTAGLLTGCIVTRCRTNCRKYDGAGINMTGGTVRGCVISNNWVYGSGGTGRKGGGVYMTGGLVENCRILNNESSYGTSGACGGGVYMTAGTLRGCLIAGNTATISGFGLYMESGTAENNTIVNNRHTSAVSTGVVLGDCRATFRNNIVVGNYGSGVEANVNVGFGGEAEYNCTIPVMTYGLGNISDPPIFEDEASGDYRLQFCPCVDAARARPWMDAVFDLTGTPRIVKSIPDIGCYERPKSTGLVCMFSASSSDTPDLADVTLTSTVDGDTEGLVYYWRVIRADGTVTTRSGSDQANPVFPLGAGDYAVELAVTNKAGKDAFSRVESAAKVYASAVYVNGLGSDVYPYASKSTGAHDFDSAFALLMPGGTAYVSAGNYVLNTTLDLASGKGTKVIGLDGPAVTSLRVGTFTLSRLPGVKLQTGSAWLEGVSVVGGQKGPYYDGDAYGTYRLVEMTSAGATITNCVFRDADTITYGISAIGLSMSNGTIVDSRFENVSAHGSSGAGIEGGTIVLSGGLVDRIVVRGCRSTSSTVTIDSPGDIIYMTGGRLRNSLITGCETKKSVPIGVSGGFFENCTIACNTNRAPLTYVSKDVTYNNNLSAGLSVFGGTARNCILSDNWATNAGCLSNLTGTVTYTLVDDRETFAGEGNKVGDPKFRRGAGKEWRLKSTSPALNAGLKLDWMTETSVDLGSTPRVRNGAPDMGCYEGDAAGLMLLVR